MLLEMKAKAEGMRALVVKAGWHLDSGVQCRDAARERYHQGQVGLLTPLIKSYASDQAFRLAELAIQVLGGAGYTKGHCVEQYCRDAKVFSVYEGTNHIQALDLVRRKLTADGGAHLASLLADLGAFLERHAGHARLSAPLARLAEGAVALERTAQQIVSWGKAGEVRRVAANATVFQEMMSEICVGWMLLDAAVLADQKMRDLADDETDRSFLLGKVYAAEHYAGWVLPLAVTRGEMIRNSPAAAVAIPDTAFATI
jgi:hypothetical protein